MARHTEKPATGPLEGEDIETPHWEDARHWMSIYDDLIRLQSWSAARGAGALRQAGKDYVMQDGDVTNFLSGR